jgi:hypothetical protein
LLTFELEELYRLTVAVKIPKEAEAGARLLANLPTTQLDALFKALKTAPPSLRSSDVTDSVVAKLPKMPRQDISALLDFLVGVAFGLRHVAQDKKNGMLHEVSLAVTDCLKGEVVLRNQNEIKRAINRALFESDTICLSAKAFEIFLSYPNIFKECTAYSDLRPLFGEEVPDKPVAAVITHTLKLQYKAEGKQGEFYVTLDLQDLKSLKYTVDRAIQKAKSLKAFAGKSQLKIVAQ